MPPEMIQRMAERDAVPPSELTICADCGIDAWAFEEDGEIVSEEFYVSDDLWDATCPDDEVVHWTSDDGTEFSQGRFVICIGCFEHRLGRSLTLRDFLGDAELDSMSPDKRTALAEEGPFDPEGAIPSKRYLDRWRTVR